MSHCFAYLMAAGLALAAGPRAVPLPWLSPASTVVHGPPHGPAAAGR